MTSYRIALCLLVCLSLNLPACSTKASLRANLDKNQRTAAEQSVDSAVQTGVLLMGKLMAQEQDQIDGPQPSKDAMKLSDKAGDQFYASYGKLKLARMAAETAVELLQMNDKSKWQQAAQNLDDAKRLLKQGSDILQEGKTNQNSAYSKSPDVDPMSKAWSQTSTMGRRATAMQRDVQATISKASRKAPRGFNLLQVKTSKGFKESSEKKLAVSTDKDEDNLVNYIENYANNLF